MSCDLTDEADTDCSGINFGSATIDDCGICSGGTTGKIANSDKDCKGDCMVVLHLMNAKFVMIIQQMMVSNVKLHVL